MSSGVRIKELTDKLESGIKDLYDSENYRHYLNTMARFNNYSPRNIMLIHQQNPHASLVATYQTWQREHERQVNRGERAIYILAPRTMAAVDGAEVTQESTQVKDADAATKREEKVNPILYFRPLAVFDVAQTSGKKLPEIAEKLSNFSTDGHSLISEATAPEFWEALYAASPVPIKTEKLPSGTNGYYSHEHKHIVLNIDLHAPHLIKTAIHEMGHAIIHDRASGFAPSDKRSTKEIEAESVAYVVAQHFGLDTSRYSFGYIAGWSAHDKSLKDFSASLSNIQQASQGLIESISKKFVQLCKDRGIELDVQEPPLPPPGFKVGGITQQDVTDVNKKIAKKHIGYVGDSGSPLSDAEVIKALELGIRVGYASSYEGHHGSDKGLRSFKSILDRASYDNFIDTKKGLGNMSYGDVWASHIEIDPVYEAETSLKIGDLRAFVASELNKEAKLSAPDVAAKERAVERVAPTPRPNGKPTGNYRKLTPEEIEEASNVSLVYFLPSIGEQLKQKGSSIEWRGGGDNVVNIMPDKPYMFKHFYTGRTGNAIKFCQTYLGMNFQEAVISLNKGRFVSAFPKKKGAAELHDIIEKSRKNPQREVFTPPAVFKDNIKLIDYLAMTRKIDRRVLDFFITEKLIYQTKETTKNGAVFSNIAFICKNFEGDVTGAIKRGFPGGSVEFRGNAANSDIGSFGFRKDGKGSLFVFEAPIDMLSYMSMAVLPKLDTTKPSSLPGVIEKISKEAFDKAASYGYLATGGTFATSLVNYLEKPENHGRYNKIYLCHDNDGPGHEARIAAINALQKLGIPHESIVCHFPATKDWNEDLKNSKVSHVTIKGTYDKMINEVSRRQKELFTVKDKPKTPAPGKTAPGKGIAPDKSTKSKSEAKMGRKPSPPEYRQEKMDTSVVRKRAW